jgi:glycosyltransferase involved in cell wall biosynthesis
MAADGHAVEVLVPRRAGSRPADDPVDDVVVRRFPARRSVPGLAAGPAIRSELAGAREKYDVVHAHNYHAVASLAPALARVRPLVFTPHYLGTGNGTLLRLSHRAYRPLGRLAFSRSDRVICVSRAESALVRRHFPSLATPITVVPNGVDVAGLRRAQAYPLDATAVVSAGRLAAYKNFELTLRALSHLSDEFRLYVAGDGPDRARLEGVSRRLRLHDRVTFLGRLEPSELHRWLRTAKAYVTVSPRECLPITLLEALAAGAPTVASDIPAHREVAEDNSAGTVALVPPDVEPSALAKAISNVAGRANGGHPFAEPPSWDAVAEEHLNIYRSLTWR